MPSAEEGPRIRLMGSSGSGKTTAARAIAHALGVPFLELDSIFWLPTVPMYERNRTPDECRERLDAFLGANPAWVMDGNYLDWSGPALERATEVVVFDPPTLTCLRRLVRRWRVGRRGLRGGDDATAVSLLKLMVYTGRYRHTRLPAIIDAVRASGVPWAVCRSDANIAALFARFPGAVERFADDVRRGRSEPEAAISGRR